MPTMTNNIDAISRAVKDPQYQKRSQQIFADICTDAQNFLVDQLEPLIKIDNTSLVMVAGQQTYNLPSDFMKFETRESNKPRGYVTLGTNGEVPLMPISTLTLDSYLPKWRSSIVTPGTPREFYIIPGGGAQITLGINPVPSATFISQYGTTCFLRYVYRPPSLNYDANLPFDNSNRLQGLNYLMKLHAIWQIAAEDQDFDKADRTMQQITERLELAKDFVESTLIIPAAVGFTPYGKNIL